MAAQASARKEDGKTRHRRDGSLPAVVDEYNDLDTNRLPRKYSRGNWPVAGAAVAFTATAAAAATIGAPEVMLALGVGYATYEIMRHRMGLLKALQSAARLEKIFRG